MMLRCARRHANGRSNRVLNAEHDREWSRLKVEHTHDRDNMNNYGCFNVEASRNCNFTYNARACIGCHNCDSLIECVQ